MPRIPDELIERIKTEVLYERLLERAGIAWKRHGESLVALCPFHPDSEPPGNLVITPAKGLFHCFACGAAGSVIDWVMKLEGLTFRAAVETLLLEFFPTEAKALGIGTAMKSTVPKLASPIEPDASDEETFDAVALYYHQVLKETPEAMAYLEKRGIADTETIAKLKLGFCDRSLGTRLPCKNRKEGLAVRSRLQRLGLYRSNGREHFRGRLTIPFLDSAGHVVGMYGRRIETHLSAGDVKHLYCAGPHRGLLNPDAFRESKEIVLCEAPLDAATFFRWYFRNVTTCYGAEGFTDELLRAFVANAVERCYIAFDRDEAGDDGGRKAAEKLMAHGVECFRVLFPKGMDANEYALKVAPGDKSLGVLLRGAEWMGRAWRVAHARDAGTRVAAPLATNDEAPCPELPLAAKDDETGEAAKEGNGSKAAREAASEALDRSRIERKSQAEADSDGVSGRIDDVGKAPEVSAAAELGADAAIAPAPEPASSNPSATSPATSDVELIGDDEAIFRFEDRRYTVQGLLKALRSGSLHVIVNAAREGDLFVPSTAITGSFLDRFDFVSSVSRQRFEKSAAAEMGVTPESVKWDLGRILRKLEELKRRATEEVLRPKDEVPPMTDEQRAIALELGSAEDLIERFLADYEKAGVVGEKTNKLVGTLGAVSRLSRKPLAIVIRSSSAAGKTALMDAVLRMIPKEAKEKYSAVSGHALFYFEGKNFKHKVLAIVEEEGAKNATYALKLLQSEGEITIASTGKDPGTGRLVTKEYRVEGPVMIFLASTDVEIEEELLNRSIVLTVDEGREQTRRIHELQRLSQTLESLWADEEREEIYERHHHLQRILRPLHVINPFVRELTFLDDKTRTRRDHTKYLGMIEASTLLHQYQRERRSETRRDKTKEYVVADLFDVALAGRLAAEVLGRTLDELGPQTRRFLMLLDEWVTRISEEHGIPRSDIRLSRRDVMEATGSSNTQTRIHLGRLIEMEYVVVHKGGRGQTFVYELLYDGQGKDGTPFLIGLADVEALAKKHGLLVPRQILEPLEPVKKKDRAVPTFRTSRAFPTTSRGHSGAIAPLVRGGSGVNESAPQAAGSPISIKTPENAHLEGGAQTYAHGNGSDRSKASAAGRPILVNLLRFPPVPRDTEPGGNGHEGQGGIVKPVTGRPARRYTLRSPRPAEGA